MYGLRVSLCLNLSVHKKKGEMTYSRKRSSCCAPDIVGWIALGLIGVALLLSVFTLLSVHNIGGNRDGRNGDDRRVCVRELAELSDVIDEFVVFGRGVCNVEHGVFNRSRFFPALENTYAELVRFDNVRAPTDRFDPTRTNITYFPAVPLAFPNGSGVGVITPFLENSNVLDTTRFKQFNGAPFTVGFFFGYDTRTISPTSRLVASGDRNVEDRGPNNLEQRQLMAALTKNKIVCRYADRVLTFVTNVYDSWVIHRLPVLSSFKEHLIDYYLDIHLGTANHPAFVKEYFNDWLFFIATIDDNEEARERTLRAHVTNPCVREYFRTRILDVIDETKTDTITYHWIKAGMPIESAITEAIRNVAVFGPLINAVNLIVTQSIRPTVVTPGTFTYTFLRLFRLATAGTGQLFTAGGIPTTVPQYTGTPEQLQINVVREFLRILIPDPLFVTTDSTNQCAGCATHTQARHIVQLIEIRGEYERQFPTPAERLAVPWTPFGGLGWNTSANLYGFYNPTKYAIGGFTASYSDAVCPGNCSACLDASDRTAGLLASVASFTTSPLDGRTLRPASEQALIPVFATPIYAPFGLGATRNPYEILIQYTLLKLFDTIQCLQFVDVCTNSPDLCREGSATFVHPLVPLAPIRAVPDSLFVVGSNCAL